MRILENETLAPFTTYRIGGPARYLALPETQEDIKELGEKIRASGLPYFILGNGSNVLFSEDGFPGWVIRTVEIKKEIEFLSGNAVHVSASFPNQRLLRLAAEKGLGGLEYLSGVPGTMGGAVAMNAGTAAGWIEQHLTEVTVVSLFHGVRVIPKEGLKFSYRTQHFVNKDEIIWSAKLHLDSDKPEVIRRRLAEKSKARKAAQPIELPSCGSVFRNPPGEKAWQLIERAGLRGHKIGGAQFSPKHCNFIVNTGGATSKDVRALIQLAKDKVFAQTGVRLEEELVILGVSE